MLGLKTDSLLPQENLFFCSTFLCRLGPIEIVEKLLISMLVFANRALLKAIMSLTPSPPSLLEAVILI